MGIGIQTGSLWRDSMLLKGRLVVGYSIPGQGLSGEQTPLISPESETISQHEFGKLHIQTHYSRMGTTGAGNALSERELACSL